MKKLNLHRETVRTLDDRGLTVVRGGGAAEHPTMGPGRHTDNCPIPSTTYTLTQV